jgi:hypothetical protein
MAGIATVKLARIHHVREVVHRSAEAIDDERRARRSADAAIVDSVDHVFKVNRLLPQTIDSYGRERLPHTYIGRSRVVASDTDLGIVIAIVAVQGEHAVAHIAFCNIHDHAACHRRCACDVAVTDRACHCDGCGSRACRNDTWMPFDRDGDIGDDRAGGRTRGRAIGVRRCRQRNITAGDFAQLMIMLTKKGLGNGVRILDAASVELMITPTGMRNSDGWSQSLGLHGPLDLRGRQLWGHGGVDRGAANAFYFNPNTGVGAIVFANANDADFSLSYGVDNIALNLMSWFE